MNNRKEEIQDFLNKIEALEKELANLYTSSFAIGELYSGTSFLEQEKLAATLENLFIAATHESASQIGFLRNRGVELINYIEFRKKNQDLTDLELKEIIENPISLELKRELLSKFKNTKEMIDTINEIRSEWNRTFNNFGYSYFKEKNKIE